MYGFGRPALPWPEQKRLIAAAQAGDRDAHDRLLRSYVGMAIAEAGRWIARSKRREDDADELAHVGLIAVNEAIVRFRLADGNRLSTVAMVYIRHAILNHRKTLAVIRVPPSAYLKSAAAETTAARDLALACRSLETRAVDDDRAATSGGAVDDVIDARPGPVDAALADESQRLRRGRLSLLDRAIESLDRRSRHVIRARLLRQPLHEIGAAIGVSKERVRQLETLARAEIRVWLDGQRDFRWP